MADPPNTAPLLGAPALPTPGVQSLRPSHEVSFNVSQVGPPSPQYIIKSDLLFIRVGSVSANQAFFVNLRILLPNGEIALEQEQITSVAGAHGLTSFFRPLPEGFLLSVTVWTNTGTLRGDCYAQVVILRPSQNIQSGQMLLCQGYLQGLNPISWPGSLVEQGVSGQGLIRALLQTQPGAGADWTFTVPAATRNRITSVSATLVTSATVANRQVSLLIDDGSHVFFQDTFQTQQAASLTNTYTAAPGVTSKALSLNSQVMGILSPAVLLTGWRVRVVTSGIQAGDQWSNIVIGTEEWFET